MSNDESTPAAASAPRGPATISGPKKPPTDEINRIIIGLGGQGSRIVNEVRKAVTQDGETPPGLEFIAVDSDRISLANLDSVPESQRIHLAAPDDHITETVVPWLPHEFRPKAGGGCGMQRLTGKAMYLVHRHRIMDTVREVARKMRQRTQVSNFMVVIVNAFGGGTGSGMVIDFALDVRADIKEVTGQDPVLFGIGIMPSRSETIQRANGVALTKELHFLLSHKEPIVIGGRNYSNPFELFFLVGREVMGIERDDDVLKSIVRFTIDLGLIPSNSGDAAAAGKGAGWVDLQDIRTLVKGAGHMFSTFGYYRAVFPADKLLEYFDALDKLAAFRKGMPGFATDLDSYRQQLEDKKIALAHAEEVWQKTKERVDRLRSNGIMGANRPDLAKLLADLSRQSEELRKMRRELARLEKELPGMADKRGTIQSQMAELEARAGALRVELTTPTQSRTQFTFALSEHEIDFLRENRRVIDEGNVASVMASLGRTPEYHDRTLEFVGKNKILYMPLVNYRIASQTAAAFPPEVLNALRKHGFVRYDAAGNPVVTDDQLWMVMAMLSSQPENVDASKVSARAFKETVEGHVARRAEVKIVPSKSKRWEVVIHSWMIGLQIAPVAPGYPPRLRELEWLSPEYEQVVREGGVAQHHAFLYGDPIAFAQMTSSAADRTSMARTNDLVTEFWASYAPIDAPARWLQMPPVIAEADVAAHELAGATSQLAEALDEFQTSDGSLAAIERLSVALTQGTEGVEAFTGFFAEDGTPMRERIEGLVSQLERERNGPKDPERLVSMEELATEAMGTVESASALLADLRMDLPQVLRGRIDAARESQGGANAAERRTTPGVARWEHAVARAENHAARLIEASGQTLHHVGELQRMLERVQEMLRSKALAGLPSKLHHKAAPFAVAMEAAVNANGNGNGHHANGHAHGTGHGHGRTHAHDAQEEQE